MGKGNVPLKHRGRLVVGIVTIYHQGARQGSVPKDLARNTRRTGLANEKKTDLVRGEGEDIAAMGFGNTYLTH
jgi:hypothetical protein